MHYCPHTEQDIKEMLATIGAGSLDDLFEPIPESIRLEGELDLPAPLSELELTRAVDAIAAKNVDLSSIPSFLGGGLYDHFVPSLIDHLVLRGEFLTSYTPYQPEASQGMLATIFEFQTMICALTGMEVANASMYDGASALPEAANLALVAKRGRRKILVSGGLHPEAQQVVKTYRNAVADYDVEFLPLGPELALDADTVAAAVDESVAAVILQTPNFYGVVEDARAIADAAKSKGALLVVSADPISLGLLEAPGNYGADVVVGDAQSLGCAPNYGGPFAGFFAAGMEHVRRMPGRIVGTTDDAQGRRGFVLTFQTREQHIRRAKATSNICTNQALMALRATIYMAALGRTGFAEVARRCYEQSQYARDRLAALPGYSVPTNRPTFKEFPLDCPKPVAEINARLLEGGVRGGVDLGMFDAGQKNRMLIAVTEKRTRAEIDKLVSLLEGVR